MGVDEATTNKIIQEIDYVGNGKINYTEFLAATLSFRDDLTDEMLLRLFKRFDVDDTGYISKENLLHAFKRLGRPNLTLDEDTQMIAAQDIEKDEQISFQEFKKMFEVDTTVSSINLTKQDSVFRPLILPKTPLLPPKDRSVDPIMEDSNASLPDEVCT